MSSPRWSRVTWMPSAASDRTAARASSRSSPATNRFTTLRVAGLPVTARRSPGRRDAASSVFCISTNGPPGREANTLTLGTPTPRGQGQMSRTRTRALIHLYDGSARMAIRAGKGDDAVRDDLQELVDEVSRLLAAPATLEDAEFTLLAFCAHDDSRAETMDAVRTRSILTRGSPAATRTWFEEFGIAAAEAPLRTPADEAAGIPTRLVLPVRHAGRIRGYLWLLDGGRIDPADDADPALAAAVDLAAEAGRILAERAAADDDLGRPLAVALTGSATAAGPAVRALTAYLGERSAQVLVALAPGPGGLPAGWRLPGAGAIATELADDGTAWVAVLVPLAAAADLR